MAHVRCLLDSLPYQTWQPPRRIFLICGWRDLPTVLVSKTLSIKEYFLFCLFSLLTTWFRSLPKSMVQVYLSKGSNIIVWKESQSGCFNYYTSFRELKIREENMSINSMLSKYKQRVCIPIVCCLWWYLMTSKQQLFGSTALFQTKGIFVVCQGGNLLLFHSQVSHRHYVVVTGKCKSG